MGFLKENFMLNSDLAVKLYNCSKDMPIYDYHCHLSAEEIYLDREFKDLYEIWLKGDHYKWRLMRFNGIDEDLITGGADPYDKFVQYVTTLERAIDNPLYHWSHLELKRCFQIDDIIKRDNAKIIWDKANAYINANRYSPKKAIAAFNVDTVVTTEEIFSDLKYHKLIKEDSAFKTKVLPSFRGDKIVNLDISAIDKLLSVTGVKASSFQDLLDSISIQLDNFVSLGAVVADMAFEGFNYVECDIDEASKIYDRARLNERLSQGEREAFACFMTLYLMREYYKRGWAVLLHIGAKRNNNTKQFMALGPDTGYDSVSDNQYISGLNKLLDRMSYEGVLGKTVVFNLNPLDNYLVTTSLGNYASKDAKVQLGISWWFGDNKYGIKNSLRDYASLAHLGSFLGMLTDSRSFISYTRHEYFRRLLSDYIAKLVNKGEYPEDMDLLTKLICDISFNNAKKYFDN